MSAESGPVVPFRVMTWNVLAHVHTHWDSAFHGGRFKTVETKEQRLARHVAIADAIMRELPDVVLLQEVDEFFMPEDWQGGRLPCGRTLSGYCVHRSYSRTTSGPMEGVVVLLRAGVWEVHPEYAPVLLPRIPERGWKCGIAVPARRCGGSEQPCCFVSVHLQWGNPTGQLRMLEDALAFEGAESCHIVLGGDFNTQPGSELLPLSDFLSSRQLGMVPHAPNALTCTGGEKEPELIDYLFCSNSFAVLGSQTCVAGPLPPRDRGAWSDAAAHDGSDHAWLIATLGSTGS